MIEIKNITKKYKNLSLSKRQANNFALNDITAVIEEGKIYAVLGVNGSGKTTLLKTVSGMVKQDKGKILIDGERISRDTYRKLIYVPDCDTHFTGFTVREMKDFYNDFYDTWNEEKSKKLMEFFGLSDDMSIDSMSRGNMAKVKLMLAFSLDMKYILLDEPFSGIDVFKRKEFIKAMTSYMEESQTIIITTHEIEEIEIIAEEVIVLNDGMIAAAFNAEEVRIREGKSILDKVREVSNE